MKKKEKLEENNIAPSNYFSFGTVAVITTVIICLIVVSNSFKGYKIKADKNLCIIKQKSILQTFQTSILNNASDTNGYLCTHKITDILKNSSLNNHGDFIVKSSGPITIIDLQVNKDGTPHSSWACPCNNKDTFQITLVQGSKTENTRLEKGIKTKSFYNTLMNIRCKNKETMHQIIN